MGQIIGYLDGQAFGSGQASQLWHRNNAGLGDRHVGTRFLNSGFPAGEDSGGFGFVGLMDDVRVYNRTLSAAEVAALMSQEVTMTVTQDTAWEDGHEGPAVLTFTRSGSVAQNLVINLAFAGTATHAVDYETTRTAAAFAPGEATTTITITPIDDHFVEPDETVLVSIEPPIPGQRPNTWTTPGSATLTILDDESADRDGDGAKTKGSGTNGTWLGCKFRRHIELRESASVAA